MMPSLNKLKNTIKTSLAKKTRMDLKKIKPSFKKLFTSKKISLIKSAKRRIAYR